MDIKENECGCGHHHHDDGQCQCGHHHHHHGEGECCCGGEHHHDGHCCHHDVENFNILDKINETLAKYDYSLTIEQAEHEAAHILEHHAAENNNDDVKKFLLSALELTSLKVTDNDESILAMVEKVNSFEDAYPELPNVAAICAYPNFAHIISNSLEVDGVKVTSVAGGFPSSQTFSEIKLVEAALALKDGADDIDIVLPVGKFLSNDYEVIEEEIEEIKNYCGDRTLKVILETGALQTAANIMKAAILTMYCGADFIKTSTGKLSTGVTPGAVYTMCQAIKQYNQRHNYKIGIKIAGGVRTVDDAVNYYTIVKEILGEEWLSTSLFRIGASSLGNALISSLTNSEVKYF